MYDLTNLGIHLEITSNCNSRCLDCGRYVKGTDYQNPHVDIGSKGNISLDTIENIFTDNICKNIKYINFTGTYGDAIIHPNFLEIVELIANKVNRPIKLMIETNGGLHSTEWWSQFSKIIVDKYSKDSIIIFALDGINDETHQLYRRGVNFDKVIENAKAVINTGANAVWSMISFAHNEHQLQQAKDMSVGLGFKNFKIRRSRLRSMVTPEITPLVNTVQKSKTVSTENVEYTTLYNDLFTVKENKKSSRFYFEKPITDSYFNDTDIVCEWKNTNKINIDYTGRVWQCCYFSTFYHAPIEWEQLDRVNEFDVSLKTREYENLTFYENQYEKNWNNVNFHTLETVLNHKFFTNDLEDSFNNTLDSTNNPRIYRCAKHCGSKARNLDTKLRSINNSVIK